ncbi:Polyprenol-phosphate-mannose-dependent alpha-(1-2)-phosphatidylinositol pentamannoside mannosyltransferase [Mycobacterium shottsii]|uniref:Polyprenol-phosphate-mannose-dependent alpha-(1-2)-phosphatidylinositol pentamannoside mannosyltransferase n=1 Tax=Mycobacterium shottsii TaxID=133549 RepID=A0A7I7L8S1_9MYCO|nr:MULTISPECIES: mannosyltransferase [Mycobacterium ulcerans group]QYL26609.1 Polyprenol-phosphate-mannose-dependent alpha-(1-2)-phosphatidylinositol pentamannoside mannosyltransferase [Mycobacterium shottsii]BBX56145.1 polyprenol-phosphate-mannose-dependent alpha-(1-2)-phosphatidylinositol pentamannoside mannosyltransferase [Mycobacterium shottsii]GJP05538.1 polyprenol-phosphate-mannose-dependent alpha-(1-2)-phosphatidylinositol pentamannoside mannosyltransferase [Mycobacterium marinum]
MAVTGHLGDWVGTRVGRIDTTSAAPAASTARQKAASPDVWGRRGAPLLLVFSVAARLAWTYLASNGANFVDLHVYVGGAAALDHPGSLYSYVYADQTPDFPLPFTYPPFAAVVFYPLHLLPFGLVAFLWQLATIAALYGAVRISQRLIGVPADRGHRAAMVWTAVAIWIEPLRSTFDYGQINVLLMLAALWAVYTTRWWLSGLLVGVAAGIKLTPAITAVYLAGVRRWRAAVCSAIVFLVSVGVSLLIVGDQARYYFTDLLGDAHRVGPIATSFNQSWRGAISRILGHDAGFGPLVLAAIAVTAVLAVLAWRALEPADHLGKLLVVEFFGLLLSPISWTHHWVWLVPLMIWLLGGPLHDRLGARILGWGWLALTIIGVPWLLSFAQPTIWQIGRPWYLAWAGLVYLVATLATLGWIATTRRRAR